MKLFPVAVAAALVLTVSGAAPAAANPDESVHFGAPVYLALGDSVAAGVGAQPYVNGYVEQLGALIEQQGYNVAADKATPNSSPNFDVLNHAISGATTSTLIANQLPKAVELIDQRNGDRDPFNDVEIITVTIGGNDFFTPTVGACLLTTNTANCQSTVDAVLAATQQRIATILGQLTAAAGPRTEVVVTTYYNPIGSCFVSQLNPIAPAAGDVVLEGGSIPGLLTLQNGFNDLVRQTAAATGAQVGDLFGQVGAGQLVGGRDCTHPNLTGHTTIANVLYGTIAG